MKYQKNCLKTSIFLLSKGTFQKALKSLSNLLTSRKENPKDFVSIKRKKVIKQMIK
jgi:hypothetical protein